MPSAWVPVLILFLPFRNAGKPAARLGVGRAVGGPILVSHRCVGSGGGLLFSLRVCSVVATTYLATLFFLNSSFVEMMPRRVCRHLFVFELKYILRIIYYNSSVRGTFLRGAAACSPPVPPPPPRGGGITIHCSFCSSCGLSL